MSWLSMLVPFARRSADKHSRPSSQPQVTSKPMTPMPMSSTTSMPSAAASVKTGALFSPLALAGLGLDNRIVVSPMCQYSADDGSATDWHTTHLGMLANSGAGLVVVEATHVDPAIAQSAWDLLFGRWKAFDPNLHVSPRMLEVIGRSQIDMGIMTAMPSLAALYDGSFAAAAAR